MEKIHLNNYDVLSCKFGSLLSSLLSSKKVGTKNQASVVRTQMSEISLVIVKVDNPTEMKVISNKTGTIKLTDADAAKDAEIIEVKTPTPKYGGEIKPTERLLPKVKGQIMATSLFRLDNMRHFLGRSRISVSGLNYLNPTIKSIV